MDKQFPQYLSAPFQVLWFEPDELSLMCLFFVFALLFGNIFWLLMFVAPWYYGRVKRKYPRGFFRHSLYFIGITEMKGYPSYFEEEFVE
ncbi:MAG: hypothetical protein CSYNP_04006 [Syntrophus sp. SKADARSKE-3]|nr:hypothetical protein [Syntrophus sp. SKADARSKE-3]